MASAVSQPRRQSGRYHVGTPLGEAGQWTLPLGLAPWPRLRQALWLLCGAQAGLLLAWVLAWWAAALAGHVGWGGPALAVAVLTAWAFAVWPAVLALAKAGQGAPHAPACLNLAWDGQGWWVPEWVPESEAKGLAARPASPGQERAPVHVHVPLAWGGWALVRVTKELGDRGGDRGESRRMPVWIVLHEATHWAGTHGHRLRALLRSQGVTPGNKVFEREEVTPTVASWRHMFTQWIPWLSQRAPVLRAASSPATSAHASAVRPRRPLRGAVPAGERRSPSHPDNAFVSTWAVSDQSAPDQAVEAPTDHAVQSGRSSVISSERAS